MLAAADTTTTSTTSVVVVVVVVVVIIIIIITFIYYIYNCIFPKQIIFCCICNVAAVYSACMLFIECIVKYFKSKLIQILRSVCPCSFVSSY